MDLNFFDDSGQGRVGLEVLERNDAAIGRFLAGEVMAFDPGGSDCDDSPPGANIEKQG